MPGWLSGGGNFVAHYVLSPSVIKSASLLKGKKLPLNMLLELIGTRKLAWLFLFIETLLKNNYLCFFHNTFQIK